MLPNSYPRILVPYKLFSCFFCKKIICSSRYLSRLTSRLPGLAIVLLLFVSFISSCSAPPGNATDGKRWFLMNNCSACHGPHGNDGRAANIAGIKMGFSSFVRKLRTTDAPIMPYFPESKVSKQDVADIYAYLKSMTSEKTR